ncbi:MAG TPA: hypothetical protein VEA16_00005, partial [Vicinamibacterales bacterium]|nr:hypothetical protein [Vicinamibacterales bacterium]
MKIHVQDSVARAAHQALQRVLKDGPAALFGPKTQQHLSLSDSHLATQHRVTTAIDRQSAVHARVSARIERSQSVDGNTVRVATNA